MVKELNLRVRERKERLRFGSGKWIWIEYLSSSWASGLRSLQILHNMKQFPKSDLKRRGKTLL